MPSHPNQTDDRRPDPAAELPPLELEAIQARFERTAASQPAKPAIVSLDETWTYGELERLSNALAAKLCAAGIGGGDVVAIVTDRNPALVCAMLAVLKAGAAFAMVNEAYPDSRVVSCLRVSRARLAILLGTGRRFAELEQLQTPVLS